MASVAQSEQPYGEKPAQNVRGLALTLCTVLVNMIFWRLTALPRCSVVVIQLPPLPVSTPVSSTTEQSHQTDVELNARRRPDEIDRRGVTPPQRATLTLGTTQDAA
jgi:hypothetical protein